MLLLHFDPPTAGFSRHATAAAACVLGFATARAPNPGHHLFCCQSLHTGALRGFAAARALNPGMPFPSMNSRLAPPPVEMCDTWGASPI
eukprot:1155308-Pelagomonas_calceolata.AAC.2